jgi:hypothetical protein
MTISEEHQPKTAHVLKSLNEVTSHVEKKYQIKLAEVAHGYKCLRFYLPIHSVLKYY